LNAFFVDALQQYGYPVLWLVVFAAAAGIPVSGSILLFAAGAFAALDDFNLFILFPIALSAAVMGDNLGYFIGRRVGLALIDWLEKRKRFRFITPERMERGREYFRRRAGWTIFITRFLIVVLGGPVNLVAGLELYPYQNFLFWDVSGQILSVTMSLGFGFAFARSWEEVAAIFGSLSSLVLAALVALFLFSILMRRLRQRRFARNASAVELESRAIETHVLSSQNGTSVVQPEDRVIETHDPASQNGTSAVQSESQEDETHNTLSSQNGTSADQPEAQAVEKRHHADVRDDALPAAPWEDGRDGYRDE
jgi:membrane-associated protein